MTPPWRSCSAGCTWRREHGGGFGLVGDGPSEFARDAVHRTRDQEIAAHVRTAPAAAAALQEQGLLDPSSQAVVVDLPTSAGKTVLAEFRILQALNQFDAEQGWVAYVRRLCPDPRSPDVCVRTSSRWAFMWNCSPRRRRSTASKRTCWPHRRVRCRFTSSWRRRRSSTW